MCLHVQVKEREMRRGRANFVCILYILVYVQGEGGRGGKGLMLEFYDDIASFLG